jgi:thiamine phosphate synthase YjbQ (UPF0047 family)
LIFGDEAAACCRESGIAEGMLLVSAMHITAGSSPTYWHQVIVPITKGKLDLGPWQQIFYYEFDGRRPKRLVLKALGE